MKTVKGGLERSQIPKCMIRDVSPGHCRIIERLSQYLKTLRATYEQEVGGERRLEDEDGGLSSFLILRLVRELDWHWSR